MSKRANTALEALADPTRRAILKRLRGGSLSAGQIAEGFDLSKPTLSHHFKVLKEAGLIRPEKRGTKIVYTLQTSMIEDAAAELMELASTVGHRLGPKKMGAR